MYVRGINSFRFFIIFSLAVHPSIMPSTSHHHVQQLTGSDSHRMHTFISLPLPRSQCHRSWGCYECFSVGPYRPPLESDFVSLSYGFSANLGVSSNRQSFLVEKMTLIRSLYVAEILTPSFPFTQVVFPLHTFRLEIHFKYWSLPRWKVLQHSQLPHFCSLRKPSQHRALRSVRLSRCIDRRRAWVFQMQSRTWSRCQVQNSIGGSGMLHCKFSFFLVFRLPYCDVSRPKLGEDIGYIIPPMTTYFPK